MALLQLPFDSGLAESAAQLVGIAGAVVLLLLLVAFGAFAYKSLTGDGIRWPDEPDGESDGEDDEDGVTRGGPDEDWKYY